MVLDFACTTAEAICNQGEGLKWFNRPLFVSPIFARRFVTVLERSPSDPVYHLSSEAARLGLFETRDRPSIKKRPAQPQLRITHALRDVMLFRAAEGGPHNLVLQARYDERFKHLFRKQNPLQDPPFFWAAPPPKSPTASIPLVAPAVFISPNAPIAPLLPHATLQQENIPGRTQLICATKHRSSEMMDLCEDTPTPPPVSESPIAETAQHRSKAVINGPSNSPPSDCLLALGDAFEGHCHVAEPTVRYAFASLDSGEMNATNPWPAYIAQIAQLVAFHDQDP